MGYLIETARAAIRWITESWQGETLSENPDPTSASNESSVVQMAVLDGDQVVLTGDVGPDGLHEAAAYAEALGVRLRPRFIQVPHHGSRRNVTPSSLNRWLGAIMPVGTVPTACAYCSAAPKDEDHPRQKVVNAFTRRGYDFCVTKGQHIWFKSGIDRVGVPLVPMPFSTRVEE